MPEETTQKNASVLPPKLTARRILPGAAPVVVPASGPVIRAPLTPVAVPVPAKPVIAPATVTVISGEQPPQGINADRKKDTARLSIDDARPSSLDAAGAAVKTVRLKSPPNMASGVKVEPLIITPAKPVAVSDDAAPGIQAKRKSDTSRIDVDAAVKAQETGTSETAPGGVRTVRIKSGPTAAASVGIQSIGGIESKVVKPVAAPLVPKVPAGQASAESKPAAGPATIRLKKPEGLKQGVVSKVGGETARILLDTSAGASGAAAQVAPGTVRIKKPDVSAVPAGEDASASTGRKTMKISRPGQGVGQPVQESKGAEDSPLTQRRTLSIKRQDDKASDHSIKMAQQEAALQGGGRKRAPLAPGQKPPERFAWAWCIVSVAAVIVIACVMWVFTVQLRPKDERKLAWPDKILSFNDTFYRSEPEWKVF